MKYTKKQRKQIAPAFRAAKRYLDDGLRLRGTPYLCYALHRAMADGYISAATYFNAKAVIERRLGEHLTVLGFLLCNGVPSNQLSFIAVQQYRHRWLDALIKEFSQ